MTEFDEVNCTIAGVEFSHADIIMALSLIPMINEADLAEDEKDVYFKCLQLVSIYQLDTQLDAATGDVVE